MSLLLQGCEKAGQDEYLKANRMLSGIETYTVTAEIVVKGNRTVENYIVKQYFKYPDRYRLEVLSPSDKKGKTTIYDGEKLWIYHPLINQMFVLDNLKEVEEAGMFPGYFAGSLFTGEEASYNIVRGEVGNYITIRTIIPGGNNYKKHQILYIDRESLKPVRMEVYDSADNIVVTVFYRDFLYNVKIDESIFEGSSLQR